MKLLRTSDRVVPRRVAAALWLAAAAALLAGPRPAAASGSEGLLVAGEWCSVELRETFRKIHVDHESAQQYRESAEARFFAALAPAWPALDRLLAGADGVHLQRFDAGLPLASCAPEAGCAAALAGAYPRLVVLPPFEVGERTVVTVTIALARRPEASRLATLAKTLQAPLRRHLRRSPDDVRPAPAPAGATLEVPGAGFFVRLRPALRPATPERAAPLEQQLAALAEALRETVAAELARSPAVVLAATCPTSGPPEFYGDTKTLPGRVAVSQSDPRLWAQAQLCIERADGGDAALDDLQARLRGALASRLEAR